MTLSITHTVTTCADRCIPVPQGRRSHMTQKRSGRRAIIGSLLLASLLGGGCVMEEEVDDGSDIGDLEEIEAKADPACSVNPDRGPAAAPELRHARRLVHRSGAPARRRRISRRQ